MVDCGVERVVLRETRDWAEQGSFESATMLWTTDNLGCGRPTGGIYARRGCGPAVRRPNRYSQLGLDRAQTIIRLGHVDKRRSDTQNGNTRQAKHDRQTPKQGMGFSLSRIASSTAVAIPGTATLRMG